MKQSGPKRRLTGPQKAAALLLTLDAETSAKLLSTLPDDSITYVGRAMAEINLDEIEREQVSDIQKEFLASVREGASIPPGLSELLTKTLGPERGKQILSRIEETVKRDRPFVVLERLEDGRLVRILRDEHPQVIALVCSRIPPDRAGVFLSALTEEERIDIADRMASMQPITRDVIDDIASGLASKAESQDAMPVDDMNRRLRSVAEILNATEPEVEKEILQGLEARDAEVAREIRERMFTFADLARLDKRGMQKVLSTIDVRALAMALKAADPEIAENFFGNMTKRVKEMVQEELELLGPVPLTEVMKAQTEIMVGIRALIEKGEIRPTRGGGGGLV
ncbi:MAG: flagellar motor switch protein FliG [Planctomycetes bacterium]|nr:flagellar motor switch protein FliG [Planctomycetota bacterium]